MACRIIHILLSFYIILLSVMPCADAAGHCCLIKDGISAESAKHHDSDADQCSPFCTCQCCQANMHLVARPEMISAPAYPIVYHECTPDFRSVDLFDFLVPPKA